MSQKNRTNFNNQKKAAPQPKPSFVSSAPQSAKKESKPAIVSSKEAIIASIIAILVFCGVAFYELVINNSDMLFMAQSRSMFSSHAQFFKELTTSPGCIIAWLGSYLTQYFYNPTLGSIILIGIWCITYFTTKKAFRINNNWTFLCVIPLVCLLASITNLGYWMYYIKQPGYYFRESLGFLMMTILMFIGTRLNKYIIAQSIFTVIAVALGYYAFGYYAILFAIYLCINEWVNAKTSILSKVIISVVSIVSALAVPYISYNRIFTEMRSEDAIMGGFPAFNMDRFHGVTCETPFYVLCALPLLFILVSKFQNKNLIKGFKANIYRLAFILIAIVAVPYIANALNFDDYNYHAECRMYRATDESRWEDVLEESANYQDTPTREMVLLNHVALIHEKKLGTHLFKYNNFGKEPKSTDSLAIHLVQTAGPMIYYHHAKTNFAYRWCIENSVEFGYNFNELKIMIRCALISGELDVARKYLEVLKSTKYYESWAKQFDPIIEGKMKTSQFKEFDDILELYNNMGTVLDGDNGLCEMYLLNYFANTINKDSKLLEEVTLAYALIQKDIQLFWPRFFLYAQMHSGEEMPIHYQEAAYLYGNLEHQVNISNMPFQKGLADRYASFQQVSQSYLQQGMSVEQVRDAMKAEFGDTFWWFYFFCRDVKSY